MADFWAAEMSWMEGEKFENGSRGIGVDLEALNPLVCELGGATFGAGGGTSTPGTTLLMSLGIIGGVSTRGVEFRATAPVMYAT